MNARLLKAKMVEKGITDQEMSKCLHIDISTFYRKKTGNSDFLRNEILIMKKSLGLSSDDIDRIFFEDELA